jgi:regulator of sigma E protease
VALPLFQNILSFWPVFPLLGIVIFFHELGHFLAAKWRGVTVLKFSLGMGPEMIGFSHGGTRYCLSWIPLGGFVQMAGDQLQEDGTLPKGGPEQFLTHPWYGRVIIAIAGPAANLVTAWVVVILTLTIGFSRPDFPNVIGGVREGSSAWTAGVREGDRFVVAEGVKLENWHGLVDVLEAADTTRAVTVGFERAQSHERYDVTVAPGQAAAWMVGLEPEGLRAIAGAVSPGMPAYRAGVKEGDRFVALDGRPVQWFHEIHEGLKGRADQPVVFTLERDGRTFDLTITPMRADPDHPDSPDGQIGIMAPREMVYTERVPFPQAFTGSFAQTGSMVVGVFRNLWLTVTRPLYYKGSVGGPIMIGQMARESARQGLDSFLWLLAMINLAIMAFNLMPVPLLDGGHIVLACLEGLRRRPISGNAYINFQKVGLVLVGSLFLFIFSQDILRPILRARAVDLAPRESTTVAPPSH